VSGSEWPDGSGTEGGVDGGAPRVAPWVAVVLDGEIVLLNTQAAVLVHLDRDAARAWRVWEPHAGSFPWRGRRCPGRVRDALQRLVEAGVILHGPQGWTRAPVRWL